MTDWPDWYQPVSVMEWEAGNLEVNIQTVSTVIDVEPAQGATFNISGDVNATIQGTASISIDAATITVGVATEKEKAADSGSTNTYSDFISVSANTDVTNNYAIGGYVIEMFTGEIDNIVEPSLQLLAGTVIELKVKDSNGTPTAQLFFSLLKTPVSFDPGIKVPSGGSVDVHVLNNTNSNLTIAISFLLR